MTPPDPDRVIHALLDERDRRIQAEDEVVRLCRRIEILDRKLVELSSDVQAPALRDAYRRGYFTGYSAGRRRAEPGEKPEQRARGPLARRMLVR